MQIPVNCWRWQYDIHEEAGREIRAVKILLKRPQVFVANRTAEMLENSSMDQWRQVKDIVNNAEI